MGPMTFRRRQLLRLAAGAAALAAVPRIATGETYPARPVRVIVPFAPGGPTDVFARLMAQKLSEQMGVQFYVENIAAPAAISELAERRSRRPTVIRSSSTAPTMW